MSIVNIGSISAVVGMPSQPGYCASKGGVFQLTRQVAIDYAAENIRCNSVGPGSVDAEFVRVYINGQADPAGSGGRLVGGHPINRMAAPSRDCRDDLILAFRSGFICDRCEPASGRRLLSDIRESKPPRRGTLCIGTLPRFPDRGSVCSPMTA